MGANSRSSTDGAVGETSEVSPSVTVIVPMRNAGRHIEELLHSLESQDYDGCWEAIVVDNESSDDSRQRAQAWSTRLDRFRLLSADGVRNASRARNAGAAVARSDLLAFIDADDVADPHWLSSIVETLEAHEIATGPFDLESLNHPTAVAWAEDERPRDRPPIRLGYLPAAMGANFGIRRETFEELGGFSEEYSYAEDVDLSWRAQLRGATIGFHPNAVVRMRVRPSITSLARQQYWRAYHGHQLVTDFAPHGLEPRSERARAMGSVRFLLVNLPRVPFSAKQRGLWVKHAAHALGWGRRKLEAAVAVVHRRFRQRFVSHRA